MHARTRIRGRCARDLSPVRAVDRHATSVRREMDERGHVFESPMPPSPFCCTSGFTVCSFRTHRSRLQEHSFVYRVYVHHTHAPAVFCGVMRIARVRSPPQPLPAEDVSRDGDHQTGQCGRRPRFVVVPLPPPFAPGWTYWKLLIYEPSQIFFTKSQHDLSLGN